MHFILYQGHNLVIGNVGDSRAIMGTRDKDNKLVPVQLSVDLKPNLPSMLFFMKNTFLYVAISFLLLKMSVCEMDINLVIFTTLLLEVSEGVSYAFSCEK